jgi:hypothetical protein
LEHKFSGENAVSSLADYIQKHTQCVARGDTAPETAVDVVFFKVVADPQADASALRDLIQAHSGQWGDADVLNGDEHSYLELGAWLGSQEYALRLIGLGTHLGLFSLLSPRTMLKDLVDEETELALAQRGLVSVQASKQLPAQV